MHRADGHQGVDELLQADVMRFMAIIAFCLIAILALVRAAETPAAPVAAPVERMPPAAPAPPAREPPAPARRADPVPEPVPEPLPAIEPVPPEPVPPIEPVPSVQAAPPVETPPPPPQTDPAPPDERGLSLRFASDQDFLRLLNRGEIRVFAFRDGRVLALGQDLALQPASAPGRLYELMPGTIPELMTSALRAAEGKGDFRWGVTLPERVVRAIREYLDAGARGTLVIDRFGEVRLGDA
ncbi:MAG TPA: hypothetical protein VF210_11000 [Pseudomonadales bacterium]